MEQKGFLAYIFKVKIPVFVFKGVFSERGCKSSQSFLKSIDEVALYGF